MALSPEDSAARQVERSVAAEAKRAANKLAHRQQTEERKKVAAERRAEAAAAAVLARSLRKKQAARASVAYSEELASQVCLRIASGQTPTLVCDDAKMPTRAQLGEWAAAHPDFAAALDRAMGTRRQTLRETMPLIASGEPGYSTGDSARDRLLIDQILRELDAPAERFGQGPAHDDNLPISYSDMKALLFLAVEGDALLEKRLEPYIGPRPRPAPLNDPHTERVPLSEAFRHARDVVATR